MVPEVREKVDRCSWIRVGTRAAASTQDYMARISVVRYPRYLGKYRDTTCDDTSIAKVTVNRGPTIP